MKVCLPSFGFSAVAPLEDLGQLFESAEKSMITGSCKIQMSKSMKAKSP